MELNDEVGGSLRGGVLDTARKMMLFICSRCADAKRRQIEAQCNIRPSRLMEGMLVGAGEVSSCGVMMMS